MGWISKIDPNLIAAALIAGVSWLYHKAKGDKQESIVDIAEGLARQAVQLYAGEPDAADKAATKIEAFVMSGLASRLGIPIAKLQAYDAIVHPVIEHAIADMLELVNQRNAAAVAAMPAQVASLAAAAKAASDAIATAEDSEIVKQSKQFAADMVDKVP